MLKKRIIPCLDIRDGRTVKGVNFVGLRDAGDPVELAKQYEAEGADELVFLDITATVEKRKTLVKLVEKIAKNLSIPFTVGGGISTIADASAIIGAGAEKVSINSSAVKNPELISQIAGRFGSQCAVLAIDAKGEAGSWEVYVHGGRTPTGIDAFAWAQKAVASGCGEILLTSMNHDGTKNGFALEMLKHFADNLPVPVIASGGAGKMEHFTSLFRNTNASAGLAASIFHFGEIPIPQLKDYLNKEGIPVRI
jgi:imidazole glycerol-phosphate synthase subunit HisF